MSKFAACLCIILPLATLAAAPLLHPVRVLAASGILTVETPLHDGPAPDAAVITLLPEGAVVVIDGPPVDGYYPVIAGDLTGWMLGDVLLLEKDEVVADLSGNLMPEAVDDALPGDQAALAPDSALGPTPIAATEPELALDPAAATPVPVEAVGEIPPVGAEGVAPAANESPLAFPGAGPQGPASVTTETPILLGPGAHYGQITTAPAGSAVEQTGHLIDGYVTVRFAGVTGWVPLDHLSPAPPAGAS